MNFPYLRVAPDFYAPIVPLEIWNKGRWIAQEGYSVSQDNLVLALT